MSEQLLTVEQAAAELRLHEKTVLRHIREGRLQATRIGKAYRIARSSLNSFAGIAAGGPGGEDAARATCIVDVPGVEVERAERIATFLQAVALSGDGEGPPLHIQTAFDPEGGNLKVVIIGSPSDAAQLLGMLQMQLGREP